MISEKEASPPSGLSVTRTTVRGSCILSNLTEGWHNLTLYMIAPREINLYKTYEKGEILSVESTRFFIDTVAEPESFPTVPAVVVSTASIAAIAAGLILYRRKRQYEH